MLSNVSNQNPVEQVAEVAQVVPTDQEVSLVAVKNSQVVTTSLRIAKIFGKQHKDVLKAVKSLDCSEDFHKRNFALMKKSIKIGNCAERKIPMYYITRDGFMFLVMGFTGKTAAKWKEAYIKAFNDMEAKLREKQLEATLKEYETKEYREYLEQVRQEDEREYQHDKEVEEWWKNRRKEEARKKAEEEAKAKTQAQTEQQPTDTAEGGILIEDYNGRRVISSLTLAKLQGREHYYVCKSIYRMRKYFVRPGSVIFKCGRTVNRGFGKGYDSPTGIVYYITAEAFKMMCKHCTTIDKDIQDKVRKAFNKALKSKNHGKTVVVSNVLKQTKPKPPVATPTPTTKPRSTAQTQAPIVASMPQTPADIMQRFVKAMGVMMGVDTKGMFNLMDKGE